MELLYLSHCVPDAPNKGEKIRACYCVEQLARHHRLHLVCFAASEAEAAAARKMNNCASVYVERLSATGALPRAGWRFLARGRCLVTEYFHSPAMKHHVAELTSKVKLDATLVFTTAMAQYAPTGVPTLLDMADVDSEKWLHYGTVRTPSFLYNTVGRRLRKQEISFAALAERTILVTEAEARLLKSFAPAADATFVENGVNFTHFAPGAFPAKPELNGRTFIAFVGAMNYYPNVEAVVWFAKEVWPELRRRMPQLEFGIVGRSPTAAVKALASRAGIWVAADPPEVVPYLEASAAVVAPLQMARGIQNKVLEALAMGKTVFATVPICKTFGSDVPAGIVSCAGANDFVAQIAASPLVPNAYDASIRTAAQQRFSWSGSIERLETELTRVVSRSID